MSIFDRDKKQPFVIPNINDPFAQNTTVQDAVRANTGFTSGDTNMVQPTSTPSASVPSYADFYNKVNPNYTSAGNAMTPAQLSDYLDSAGKNSQSPILGLNKPTAPTGYFTPTINSGTGMGSMFSNKNGITLSDSPMFAAMGSTYKQPSYFDSYQKQLADAETAARQDAIFKTLAPSNPGLVEPMFNNYWKDSSQGTSLYDKMPQAGGINYAQEYLNGVTPDQFGKDNPTLVSGAAPNPGSGGLGTTAQTTLGLGSSTTGSTAAHSVDVTQGANAAANPTAGAPSAPQPITPGATPSATATAAGNGTAPIMQGPGYATGGTVGAPPNGAQPPQGGQPTGLAPQGGAPTPMNASMVDAQTQDMLARNPQIGAKMKAVVDQAIQSGEINPQQCHVVVQLAQACINNPALWPQLRQWAVSQGLCGPNDLPQQYDQGLVVAILAAAKVYDHGGNATNAMMGQPQGQVTPPQGQGFAMGGKISGPGTGTSDSIQAHNTTTGKPLKVSNGEYIVPQHVVAAKGTEFFDNLVNKYSEGQPQQ
jgi:hypothetical protein